MECLDEVLLEGPADGELLTLIHGWPDDLRMWDELARALLATGKYRCLRITMPGYGNRHGKGGRPVVDPNFHEVAAMVADAIRRNLNEPTEKTSLVIHDWGSWVGVQLQRLFPGLVSRMVIMDVGPLDAGSRFGANYYQTLSSIISLGVYYQWINSIAYWLWRAVPLVGAPLGNLLHSLEVKRFKRLLDSGELHPRTNVNQSASAAYFYHYYQKDFFLDQALGLSLRGGSPLASRPSGADGLVREPSVPCLFLYGHKGLGRAWQQWIEALLSRTDSDVLRIYGTHWFMLDSPNETAVAVLDWLDRGPDGGKIAPQIRAEIEAQLVARTTTRRIKNLRSKL